jgi:hypothetical protein
MHVARQEIFAETFLLNRGRYINTRRDKGVKRGRGEQVGTEAQFLRRRRLCAGLAAGVEPPASVEAALLQVSAAAEGIALEEKQEKALKAASGKRFAKTVQAFLDGALAEEEITPEVRAAAAAELKARTERAKARANKVARVAAVSARKCSLAACIKDLPCFIDHIDDEAAEANLRRQLAGRLCEREVAKLFIAADPLGMGQRSKWAAVLNGAYVVTPRAFNDHGNLGPAVKYKDASRIRRWVYMTPGFRERHQYLVTHIQSLCRAAWSFVDDFEDARAS